MTLTETLLVIVGITIVVVSLYAIPEMYYQRQLKRGLAELASIPCPNCGKLFGNTAANSATPTFYRWHLEPGHTAAQHDLPSATAGITCPHCGTKHDRVKKSVPSVFAYSVVEGFRKIPSPSPALSSFQTGTRARSKGLFSVEIGPEASRVKIRALLSCGPPHLCPLPLERMSRLAAEAVYKLSRDCRRGLFNEWICRSQKSWRTELEVVGAAGPHSCCRVWLHLPSSRLLP